MPSPTMKYNPAFLTEQELVDSFVVRQADLDFCLRVVRENIGDSDRHVLVVGPRGIGKTTLVLRAAVEIRRTPELAERWYPIMFAEESYQVASAGEFWLEALFHVARQTESPQWLKVHADLRTEPDEERLRERALTQLLAFADTIHKRLLLVVENLDMLLGEQLSDEEAHHLGNTLRTEGRIKVLASATRRFEEVEDSGESLFEVFTTHDLRPIDTVECATLWRAITGQDITVFRARPIEILTGGNPRLVRIIAQFGAGKTLRTLMMDLTRLVDEHTEYFKSHLDGLPAAERKAYLSLAELWEPATAAEVARAARLDVNKTSAFLNRLAARGAVVAVDRQGRKKSYQVVERMYNIYHLMRRRGGPSSRVLAAVNFIVGMYAPEELAPVAEELIREACEFDAGIPPDYYRALDVLMRNLPDTETRRWAVRRMPPALLEGSGARTVARIPAEDAALPHLSEEWADREKLRSLRRAMEGLDEEPARARALEAKAQELIHSQPRNALYWMLLGVLLEQREDGVCEAEHAYRQAVEIDPGLAGAWALYGRLLHEKLERLSESEQAYRKAVQLDEGHAWAWALLGRLLHGDLGRFGEAEQSYRKAIQLDGRFAWAWAHLGLLLHEKFARLDEAEQAYRMAIRLENDYAWAWALYGRLLHEKLERFDEAEQAYRRAIQLDGECAWAWAHLADLLDDKLGRLDEAEQAYRKAIQLDDGYAWAWALLGRLLHEKLGRLDEAEQAYRNALARDEDYAWAWALLGRLLDEEPDRLDEAERAYRNAVQRDDGLAWAWLQLGRLLDEKLERFSQAEQAYRKAAQLGDWQAWTWALLGRLLHEKLGRLDEAEQAYRKAIHLDEGYAWAWAHLGRLLDEKLERFGEAEQAYRRAIQLDEGYAWAWARLGRLLHEKLDRSNEAEHAYRKAIELEGECLRQGEFWARQAVAMDPANIAHQHTLACILCASGKPEEAQEHAAAYLRDVDLVRANPDDATELFVGFAVAGLGRDALRLIEASPSAVLLEPLVVALRLDLGEKTKAPVEIVEVAKDVVRRIEKRRARATAVAAAE
ncbi:MAG TPA: tetratricopeptide repeat protein [Candidatus Hydrogenedentes bacterium]|nr:tetratricopeptide repeat protein [Candidatus Hydrogenedentota bacterium]HPG65970.1 tetratricopeptide repeat protein [Candidatus Hydrogenedentota bacterium]